MYQAEVGWFRRDMAWRLAGAAALLLLLWSVTPPAQPRLRLCAFHWITGRNCPLCGMTRAMFALAKGHWREAIAFNALSPLGFLMVFSVFWETPGRARFWKAGLAAFAVYGVLRVVFPAA